MLTHKRLKEKGKLSLTKYFQEFKPGESVAVIRELSVPFSYSNRIHGKTGKVIEKRGSSYYIEVKDINKPKKYLLRAIHLKRIQDVK